MAKKVDSPEDSGGLKMSKNYEWYIHTDTSEFEGKWIAIVDQRVIAQGENAKDVLEEAERKFPDKVPSITKVPKRETLVLLWIDSPKDNGGLNSTKMRKESNMWGLQQSCWWGFLQDVVIKPIIV